jgi:fibrillarin-like pre-rRNA processing protein
MKKLSNGIYRINDRIATKNLVPGESVYGEKLVKKDNTQYRLWNPRRSKLSAAIYNGLEEIPIFTKSSILYLGAASGTTASHISDIANEGVVYCVEFSPTVFRKLVDISKKRTNMIPILSDAKKPMSYSSMVERCDVIYQDVAQAAQAEILIENSRHYLKKGGHAILALKARSIDVTKNPRDVFSKEVRKLKKAGFKIIKFIDLGPFEKDHAVVVCVPVDPHANRNTFT